MGVLFLTAGESEIHSFTKLEIKMQNIQCSLFTRCHRIPMLYPVMMATFFFLAHSPSVLADQASLDGLGDFGITGLQLISESDASEVRGSALQTSHFGISFISGMLYDPSTSSFIKGHSIQLTEAEDFVSESNVLRPFAESTVTWDREAVLQVESTFVDLQSSMRGLVQATGFSLSTY